MGNQRRSWAFGFFHVVERRLPFGDPSQKALRQSSQTSARSGITAKLSLSQARSCGAQGEQTTQAMGSAGMGSACLNTPSLSMIHPRPPPPSAFPSLRLASACSLNNNFPQSVFRFGLTSPGSRGGSSIEDPLLMVSTTVVVSDRGCSSTHNIGIAKTA